VRKPQADKNNQNKFLERAIADEILFDEMRFIFLMRYYLLMMLSELAISFRTILVRTPSGSGRAL
jgi:hypothetical protein